LQSTTITLPWTTFDIVYWATDQLEGVYGTGAAHFSGMIDVSGIVDWDPNAAIKFKLNEKGGGWFSSDGTESFAAVDNVMVSAVPEPSIIALFGLGLLGLGFARRKVRS